METLKIEPKRRRCVFTHIYCIRYTSWCIRYFAIHYNTLHLFGHMCVCVPKRWWRSRRRRRGKYTKQIIGVLVTFNAQIYFFLAILCKGTAFWFLRLWNWSPLRSYSWNVIRIESNWIEFSPENELPYNRNQFAADVCICCRQAARSLLAFLLFSSFFSNVIWLLLFSNAFSFF